MAARRRLKATSCSLGEISESLRNRNCGKRKLRLCWLASVHTSEMQPPDASPKRTGELRRRGRRQHKTQRSKHKSPHFLYSKLLPALLLIFLLASSIHFVRFVDSLDFTQQQQQLQKGSPLGEMSKLNTKQSIEHQLEGKFLRLHTAKLFSF